MENLWISEKSIFWDRSSGETLDSGEIVSFTSWQNALVLVVLWWW